DMAVLELVHSRPDWMGALTVALTRPPGVPERRGGDDPWHEGGAPGMAARPRRISDDLAWLRQAYDEPEEHGLQSMEDTAAVAATGGAAIEVPTKSVGRWNALRERVNVSCRIGRPRRCGSQPGWSSPASWPPPGATSESVLPVFE